MEVFHQEIFISASFAAFFSSSITGRTSVRNRSACFCISTVDSALAVASFKVVTPAAIRLEISVRFDTRASSDVVESSASRAFFIGYLFGSSSGVAVDCREKIFYEHFLHGFGFDGNGFGIGLQKNLISGRKCSYPGKYTC